MVVRAGAIKVRLVLIGHVDLVELVFNHIMQPTWLDLWSIWSQTAKLSNAIDRTG